MTSGTTTRRPKVLAIVVTWNKRVALETMLKSLHNCSSVPFDTVVIDNASTDGSTEMVHEKFPWAHVIQTPENIGGTGGFNRGMKYGLNHPAGYEFLWLLDNDVLVHPGALDGLLAAMDADPKIAVAGSTILLMNDPTHVQEAGVRFSWSDGEIKRQCEGPLARIDPERLIDVDYVAACSALARVSAVREVGIWDPNYFLFWDDIDWGLRFRQAGWRVVATGKSLVRHESYNDRRSSSAVVSSYLWDRNMYYCYARHCPTALKVRRLFRHFRISLASADNYEVDGFPAKALALRLAIRHFMRNLTGPPTEDVMTANQARVLSPELSSADKVRVHRIAVLAENNPSLIRAIYERVTAEFPHAEVDTLVLNESPEMAKEELPRKQQTTVRSFLSRVRLAVSLARSYDAIASPSFMQPYFFTSLVPLHMRFMPDLTFSSRLRRLPDTIGLMARRIGIVLRAANLAMRSCFVPLQPVDYHNFSELPYETRESDGQSHWFPKGGQPARPRPFRRLWWISANIVLFPFVVLTVAGVLILLPILSLIDRLKGR